MAKNGLVRIRPYLTEIGVVCLTGVFLLALAFFRAPVQLAWLGTEHVAPVLMALATEAPEQPVRVVIQKQTRDDRVDRKVIQLGGTITKELYLLNVIVAELPAGLVPALAQTPGVLWMRLDVPVIHAGTMQRGADQTPRRECGLCADSSARPTGVLHRVWAPVVQDGTQFVDGERSGISIITLLDARWAVYFDLAELSNRLRLVGQERNG